MDPFFAAVSEGNLAEVERLVAADGSLVNARPRRHTPLTMAAWKGHEAVVARLLALGANASMLNWRGDAPAEVACRRSRASILAMLLDAGAPVIVEPKPPLRYQRMPLLIFAITRYDTKENSECVKVLLTRGASPNVFGTFGTPLHYAARNGHTETVRLLLQAGADYTIRWYNGGFGDKPIDLAVRYGHEDCVALLDSAERARALVKARALLDATRAIAKACSDAAAAGEAEAGKRARAAAVAPACLKERVGEGKKLPVVKAKDPARRTREDSKRDAAVVRYVLGMEGGEDGMGLLPELFEELREMFSWC